MDKQSFETPSVRMERVSRLTLQAPGGDVDRILGAVLQITPLTMGRYGTVEVPFELPDDQQLIDLVIEAICQTHSYQEPTARQRQSKSMVEYHG